MKNSMKEVLHNPNYDIFIDDSLESLNVFLEERKDEYSKYYILVDENTHTACIPKLLSNASILQNAEILEVDAGEENKNLIIANGLWEVLLENNANRQTLIINLGGGLVSDLGGFVASTFKRGIPFINVPTTLLAQADAAIGSKTAVNLGLAKNQIGTFAHPEAVFISTEFISSLPERDRNSAFGEILKYALIADAKLWEVLKNQSIDDIHDYEMIVSECAKIKNNIVTQDPKEKGVRKILNFGHTIGHAFESFSMGLHNRQLFHGEAIALGMIVEMYISSKVLGFDNSVREEIQQYILDNFVILPIEEKDFEELMAYMKKDKKNTNSEVSFVLISEIGEAHFNQNIEEELILEALAYYSEL